MTVPRKSVVAPAHAPHSRRNRDTLMRGPNTGALTRGVLYDGCVDEEIIAYYNRRFVIGGRKKTLNQPTVPASAKRHSISGAA